MWLRRREVSRAFPAAEAAAVGQLAGLTEVLWQGVVRCWRGKWLARRCAAVVLGGQAGLLLVCGWQSLWLLSNGGRLLGQAG